MAGVTIQTDDKAWHGGEIVGTGMDSLIGDREVLIVRHPHFEYDLEFYAREENGRHYNVGNYAFWATHELQEGRR